MQEPAIASLAGRVWSYVAWSVTGLAFVGLFGTFVGSGWGLPASFLGAVIAASLLYIAGILVRQQHSPRRNPE